jgi:hypothetical protein
MSSVDLYSSEALLDERERICLAGYLLMKQSDSRAMLKAYVYSRSYPVKDEVSVIEKKAQKWFNSPKVQAFITLWEKKGTILNDESRQKIQQEEKVSAKPEEMSATEEIIQRYEQLYAESEDIDEKAKILKLIVDARHKNKDEVKDDTKTTRIYLPLRCSECQLYIKEKEKIL